MKKKTKNKSCNNQLLKDIKNTIICRYKIIADNITHLTIFDNHKNIQVIKSPTDILYNQEYLDYSKEDIIKIGFICGQMHEQNKNI